jgi:predicted dienelactone hydrolase
MLMDTARRALALAQRLAPAVAAMLLVACSAPAPRGGPGAPDPAAPAVAPPPLPVPPWRDDPPLAVASGRAEWTDPSRDRTIDAQWSAPSAVAPRALVLVLPGLAQGTFAPPALVDALAGAGFAVVVLGHPGNDATVWQGPDARRADFTRAARRMYAANEVAERGADVRFVLDALERQAPAWLPPAALRAIGAVGIGLGAQTVQWLLGEPMARGQAPVGESRIRAAALLGPYVGFEGPAMHQRYGSIVTPLLVAYGLSESDPYGLGMTSQQRRAMVAELSNAPVTEMRLPTSSLVGALAPGTTTLAPAPQDPAAAAGGGTMSRGESSTRSRPPGGTASGGGVPQGSLLARRPAPDMAGTARPAGVSAGDRAARVALLLSVQAFFEAQLLGSGDAREWLEGPHPGPVQWTTYAAPRARP